MKSLSQIKSIVLIAICLITFSCKKKEEIKGCTNSESLNHNPKATIEDGSCVFINDYVGTYHFIDQVKTKHWNGNNKDKVV